MSGYPPKKDIKLWSALFQELDSKIESFKAVGKGTGTNIALRLADIVIESDFARQLIFELKSIKPEERERAAQISVQLHIDLENLRSRISQVLRKLDRLSDELYGDEEFKEEP